MKQLDLTIKKYQISCDRKLQFPKPIVVPSTKEKIYALSLFIKTDEIFRDDGNTQMLARNFKNNYNIIVSYDNIQKELAFSYVKGKKIAWEIDKYMLWYNSIESDEISKEKFEEILKEIGHLIATTYNLKTTTYKIHLL